MPAQGAATQLSATRRRKLGADVATRDRPRAPGAGERLARLEDQRLHLVGAHADDVADLLVGEIVELGEHERRALILGEASQVDEQLAQVLAGLHLLGEPVGDVGESVGLGQGPLALRAQRADALVARDRVEPRPQRDRLIGAAQPAVGGEEGLLDRVLGFLPVADEMAAEGQDRRW